MPHEVPDHDRRLWHRAQPGRHALAEAATEAGHTAQVVDAFAAGAPVVGKWLTSGFIQLLQSAPGLYRAAYQRTEVPGHSDRVRRAC